MTRSEMRLALLTSVMTWRPQLDAAGVKAEADVLWGWVEKPAGESVPLLPLVVPPPGEMGTGVAQRLRIEPVAVEPPAAVVEDSLITEAGELPPVEMPPPDFRREKLLAALVDAAREGRPCPPDDDLVAVTGYRHKNTVRHGLSQLRKAGVIRIEKPDGAPVSSPVRRIRIVAQGIVTGWTKDVGRPFALTPHLTRLLAALTAAAEAGAACPTNDELRQACNYYDAPAVSRGVSLLQEQNVIRVELDFGAVRRRRVTIVSTGKSTDWTAGRPHRFGGKKETPPCAASDGPSSTAAPVSRSEPAPTTPAPAAPGPAPSPAASSAPSPASPLPSAAPSSPPVAASAPVAAPEPPVVRLAAGPVPTPAPRRAPLPPPPPKVRPTLRADEQAAIEAAVAAGLVKVVPTGATGVTMRNQRGEVMEVPPPFPDAPAWAREAAVYLQKRNVQVVTNGTGKWLLDGRWSVTDVELVERANKKRAHQKLPPFEVPADAGKKRGRAA